jgi:hypothetical protein
MNVFGHMVDMNFCNKSKLKSARNSTQEELHTGLVLEGHF